MEVVELTALHSPEFERVLVAEGAQNRDLRALAFEQGVRRHGRTVNMFDLDLRLRGIDSGALQHKLHAVADTLDDVLRRWRFRIEQPITRVPDDIRECSTDINADPHFLILQRSKSQFGLKLDSFENYSILICELILKIQK